jgi:hypothetical protein
MRFDGSGINGNGVPKSGRPRIKLQRRGSVHHSDCLKQSRCQACVMSYGDGQGADRQRDYLAYLWLSQALTPVARPDDFWAEKGRQLIRFGPFDDSYRLLGRAAIPFLLWLGIDLLLRRRRFHAGPRLWRGITDRDERP